MESLLWQTGQRVGICLIACTVMSFSGAAADDIPSDGEAEVEAESESVDAKVLVENNCLACHRTDDPDFPNHNLRFVFGRSYDAARWEKNVGRMEKIALHKEYIDEPWPPEEKEAMVKYLAEQTSSVRSKWVEAGMSHFAVVHFPIVLLFLAGLAEVVALPMRWALRRDGVHVVLWLAVLSCALAVLLGLWLASEVTFWEEDLADHQSSGFFALGFSVAAVLLREVAVSTQKRSFAWLYRLFLILAIVSVAVAGHLGGSIVHGEYQFFPMVLTK